MTSRGALLRELHNFDWGNLRDLQTMGIWPGPVKAMLALLLLLACLLAGYWFLIRDLQTQLQLAQQQEQQLISEFEQKAFMAANLEDYRRQTVAMAAAFASLLRQLPEQTEVPDLVDDITATGLGSGLSFSRIELAPEQPHEFYFEQPIQLAVRGNYHELGAFVSGVSSLPRIVTLHDFRVRRDDGQRRLMMELTARTYRYRDSEFGP
jgi:type IV pilus assembly protein PilO